jgi:hypothetical protein
MQSLKSYTQSERDAGLTFGYRKSKNPKTKLHTIHTFHAGQNECFCGRYERSDMMKLINKDQLSGVSGLLCKRCTWHDPAAQERLCSGSS